MPYRIREAIRADIPAIAKVHVDAWRSTYQGIVTAEYLANLSYEAKAQVWRQIMDNALADQIWLCVAENELGEIVGFACGGPERTGHSSYRGELMAIYILQAFQNQGIGRALVRAIVTGLSQANTHSMLVWVLAENPACQFYAALGGQRVEEKEIAIGGKALLEIAYGWLNTERLRK